jgi:hypothetical protein
MGATDIGFNLLWIRMGKCRMGVGLTRVNWREWPRQSYHEQIAIGADFRVKLNKERA